MNTLQMRRLATVAACLVIAGMLFVLFPVVRPFFDESSIQGAREFESNQ